MLSTARRSRRRKPATPDEDGLALVAAGDDPFATTAALEALRRVDRALATLDLEHRAVFVLFELEGESCESIAAGLGVPVGTVYSRLHHARRKFREAHARALSTVRPHALAASRGEP